MMRSICIAIVSVVALLAPSTTFSQTILAGATAGASSVSDSGAANYEIKLTLPPGVGDMVPDLSLRYTSDGPDGLLGVGWTLNGLPAIRRCPKAFATDGAVQSITLTRNDAICLEGERLVNANPADLQDGNSLENNTEFRTERESFSRVIAKGSQGAGPMYFTLEAKTGRKLEFGNTTDSRIQTSTSSSATALSWHLNRVSDRAGNYFTIEYTNSTGNGIRATKISYTGNTAPITAPFAEVEFIYETRPDPISFFEGGSTTLVSGGFQLFERNRLTNIRTKVFNPFANPVVKTVVRDYRLAYEPFVAPAHSRLTSIQECTGIVGDPNAACLPATQITWKPKPAVSWNMVAWPQSQMDWSDEDLWFFSDVMGNGHSQVLVVDKHVVSGSAHAVVRVFDRSASGYVQVSQLDTGLWKNSSKWFVGDYNADGFSDLVLHRTEGATATLGVFAYAGTAAGSFLAPVQTSFDGGPLWMTDLNGDGRSDIAYEKNLCVLCDPTTTGLGVWAGFSSGTGSFPSGFPPGWPLTPVPPGNAIGFPSMDIPTNHPAPLEVTGDSRLDGAQFKVSSQNKYLVRFAGWGGGVDPTYFELWNDASAVASGDIIPLFGDLNGDGATDIIRLRRNSSGDASIMTSLGLANGLFQTFGNSLALNGTGWGAKFQWIVVDVNLDGRDDLVRVRRTAPGQPAIFDRLLSKGDGSFTYLAGSTIPNSPFPTSNRRWLSADTSGDGFPDIVLIHQLSSGVPVIYDFEQVGGARDQVASIQNGLGAVVGWDYGVLSNPIGTTPIYTKGTGTSYPEIAVQPAFPVVKTAFSSDGNDGTRQVTYTYADLRMHAQGRGSLGFGSIIQYDPQSGLTKTSVFRSNYPLQGMQASVTVTDVNGTALSYISNGYQTPANAPPNLSSTTEVKREPGTGAILNTITTTQSVDAYNNPLVVTKTTTDTAGNAYVETVTRTYTYDVLSWKLGILASETRSVSAPNVPTQSRTRTYQVDAVTGFVARELIDPNQTFQIQRDFLRNSFGLITQTTTSAGDIVTRVEQVGWSADGRFPTSTTNALGHLTTRTFDSRFGFVTSETNPNLVTSNRVPDPLGRLSVSIPGDGSDTTTLYHQGGNACGRNSAMWIEQLSAAGPQNRQYLDELGREICKSTASLDGRFAQVSISYDSVGRVASTSRPYFEGDAVYNTLFLFDPFGRPYIRIEPTGTISYAYHGREMTITNQLSQTRKETYDAVSRLTKVRDNLNQEATYQYDAAGNLTSVTEPAGATTTMAYDLRGRMTSLQDPDRGIHYLTYNSVDDLILEVNGRNQATLQIFDQLDRVTYRGNTAETWLYTYDTAAHGVGAIANTSRSEGGFARTYEYDPLGRPFKETLNLSGDGLLTMTQFTTQLAYDIVGRLWKTTYPTGLVTRNDYNAYGYLSEVRNDSGNASIWKAEAAQADGSIIQERLGNGIVTQRSFQQSTGLLLQISGNLPPATGNLVQNDTYTWDNLGNLKTRATNVTGYVRSETFAYDGLNRLQSTTPGTGSAVSLTYGPSGNITFKTDVGNYSLGGSGGSAAHAPTTVAGRSYSYDLDGNQTTGWLANGTQRTITWDPNNKPTQATAGSVSSTFSYGPATELLKQLSSKPTETTYQVFVGKHFDLFQSRPNASTPWKVEYRSYVRVGDRLIAIRTEKKDTPSGPIVQTLMRYAHTDHLGSAVAMSDSLGGVIDRADFDSWGKRRPAGAPIDELTTISPAFTGHKQIEDLQLVHMGGRVYDPALGVFLSADPFVEAPGNTQGWNPYTYVFNNPLSFTDPTGYISDKARMSIIIGIAFGPEFALLSQFRVFRHLIVPVLRAIGLIISFTPFGYLAPAFSMAAAGLQVAYDGGSAGDIFKAVVIAAAGYAAGVIVGAIVTAALYSIAEAVTSAVATGASTASVPSASLWAPPYPVDYVPPAPAVVIDPVVPTALVRATSQLAPALDLRTEMNIRSLHSEIQGRARQQISQLRREGYDARVTSGTRTYSQQDALYAQGRPGGPPGPRVTAARGGESLHNFGLAYDIDFFDESGNLIRDPGYSGYERSVEIGTGLGMEPGANFGHPDFPHFQYTGGHSIGTVRGRFESGVDVLTGR